MAGRVYHLDHLPTTQIDDIATGVVCIWFWEVRIGVREVREELGVRGGGLWGNVTGGHAAAMPEACQGVWMAQEGIGNV